MTLTALFPPGAKPLGPYSPGIAAGDYVFLAGQIPIDAKGDIVPGGIEEQTEQVFKNIDAVLNAAGLSFANVVKATVFMTDLKEFQAMNAIYQKHVATPYPARSTVQVAALPMGARVEIEMLVYRGK